MHSPYLDNLVDDDAIGTLVSDYDELLAGIEKYLTRPMTSADHALRQNKMQDVDADTFATRMLSFLPGRFWTIIILTMQKMNIQRMMKWVT